MSELAIQYPNETLEDVRRTVLQLKTVVEQRLLSPSLRNTGVKATWQGLYNLADTIVDTYQPLNVNLTALAALAGSANKGFYFDSSTSMSLFTLTNAGRNLLDDVDAAAQRTTLGLGTAAQSNVGDFAAASHTHPASAISDSTAAGRALLTDADAAAQRTSLGLGNSATLNTGTAAGTVATGDHTHAELRAAYYGVLTADYALANSGAAQKAFNWSTNGALTLPTGYYRFKAMLHITGMSTTSGNAAFAIKGAGTATLANIFYHGVGIDNANPLAAGTQTGSFSTTDGSAASIVTGGAPTALGVEINGVFNVTATGTIIPSITLTTAIGTAVMKAGSFFHCERIGATGSNTSSGWS